MTRNDFMINPHASYVAKLGFKLATPGSAVRRTTHCAVEPGHLLVFNPAE